MFYKKRIICLLTSLSIAFSGLTGITAWADEEYPWPSGPQVMAESAILMEAGTGTILYEKNSHDRHYPASITKILTGLLTVENCEMDEIVTYSSDAIFSIEPGSNHIALNPGEQLTVENSMYGLLLASANEVANGLGEHISGTMSDFALLMTQRAKELGALDSNFVNANGLHDDNHYTTSYDMALIAQAAFSNELFMKFDSTPSYTIPPTNLQPEARVINMGHKMLRKNQAEYYEGALGGKTGYTVKSKNTLVTCAERDGVKLICVVMMADQTHYTDTKSLLDWGFENFKNLNIAENDATYQVEQNARLDFLAADSTKDSLILLNQEDCVTLPKAASFSTLVSSITYDFSTADGDDALALISYHYGDRLVGTTTLDLASSDAESFTFLMREEEDIAGLAETETEEPIIQQAEPAPLEAASQNSITISRRTIIIGVVAVLAVAGIVFLWFYNDTPKRRRIRRERINNLKLKYKSRKLHF